MDSTPSVSVSPVSLPPLSPEMWRALSEIESRNFPLVTMGLTCAGGMVWRRPPVGKIFVSAGPRTGLARKSPPLAGVAQDTDELCKEGCIVKAIEKVPFLWKEFERAKTVMRQEMPVAS